MIRKKAPPIPKRNYKSRRPLNPKKRPNNGNDIKRQPNEREKTRIDGAGGVLLINDVTHETPSNYCEVYNKEKGNDPRDMRINDIHQNETNSESSPNVSPKVEERTVPPIKKVPQRPALPPKKKRLNQYLLNSEDNRTEKVEQTPAIIKANDEQMLEERENDPLTENGEVDHFSNSEILEEEELEEEELESEEFEEEEEENEEKHGYEEITEHIVEEKSKNEDTSPIERQENESMECEEVVVLNANETLQAFIQEQRLSSESVGAALEMLEEAKKQKKRGGLFSQFMSRSEDESMIEVDPELMEEKKREKQERMKRREERRRRKNKGGRRKRRNHSNNPRMTNNIESLRLDHRPLSMLLSSQQLLKLRQISNEKGGERILTSGYIECFLEKEKIHEEDEGEGYWKYFFGTISADGNLSLYSEGGGEKPIHSINLRNTKEIQKNQKESNLFFSFFDQKIQSIEIHFETPMMMLEWIRICFNDLKIRKKKKERKESAKERNENDNQEEGQKGSTRKETNEEEEEEEEEWKRKKREELKFFFEWEKEIEQQREHSIESKPYPEWTKEEVQEFLGYVRGSYEQSLREIIGEEMKDITGKDLLEWGTEEDELEDHLEDIGVADDDILEILIPEMMKMIERGNYFHLTNYHIQEKVKAMLLKAFEGDLEQLKKHKAFDQFIQYSSHFSDMKKIAKALKMILTKNENFVAEHLEKQEDSPNEKKRKERTFKVKFIITENLQTNRAKQLRRLLGLPLSLTTKAGLLSDNIKWGMFHAAMSIGPLQLEWVDNSLTLIRSMSSEKVILCVDVGYVQVPEISTFCVKLANEIVKWNRNFRYDVLNFSNKKFHANCQQFVEYFAYNVLNIPLHFNENINRFINGMKERGTSSMIFEMSKNFSRSFDCLRKKSRIIKFESHQQLDDFVHELIKEKHNFHKEFPSQFEFLKGFDRAFWMRYMDAWKKKKKAENTSSSSSLIASKEIDYEIGHAPSRKGCPFNRF